MGDGIEENNGAHQYFCGAISGLKDKGENT